MPPRIASRSTQLRPSVLQLQCLGGKGNKSSQTRDFTRTTSTPFHASCRQETRLRRNMFAWLNGPGQAFREPYQGSTNYLGAYNPDGTSRRPQEVSGDEDGNGSKSKELEDEEDGEGDEVNEEELDETARRRGPKGIEDPRCQRPFPLNDQFRSEKVLSEELREEVWKQVVEHKQSISTVSVVYNIDMRRVAAVVRLKTIEKDWIAKGEKLATPYASAVLAMLPTSGPRTKHESINDLPVHPWTRQQIFHPTSESRQFTRADAAKIFSPTLLPADDRIPHPELVELERAGTEESRQERIERQRRRDAEEQAELEAKQRRRAEWEAKNLRTFTGQRWDFKFTNVSVDTVGKDGRGKGGVGWRYGNPHNDRKRGMVKIPTSVE